MNKLLIVIDSNIHIISQSKIVVGDKFVVLSKTSCVIHDCTDRNMEYIANGLRLPKVLTTLDKTILEDDI